MTPATKSTTPLTKTKFFSVCTGKLAKGCSECVQGRKLVLFVTGLCAQRCFYCPVSEQKFSDDSVYANEWKIKDSKNPVELFEEARVTGARGCGITGGDPLMRIDRTVEYITLLKKKFSKSFHIHLYTPLKLVTEEKLEKLFDAGLDEIRFHPDLDDNSLWEKIGLAKKYSWTVGIEIPAIPGYTEKTKKLIDFISNKISDKVSNTVSFINLNELELSDTDAKHYRLHELGFIPKNDTSYGVKGSKETALILLKYAQEKNISGHFCTAKLKDSVQVKKRLEIRAQNTKLPFDIATTDGTLIRGCIYLPALCPGMKYRERLKQANRNQLISELTEKKKELQTLFVLKEEDIFLDTIKLRLITNAIFLKKHKNALKKMKLAPAIVEEFPTADAFEVDVLFL